MNESILPASQPDQAWVVVHARPRCEKRVVEFCETRSIYAYLPLLKKKHRYGGRVRTFEIPLFTGYLFVLGIRQDIATVRQNVRVANVLDVPDQKTFIYQLEQIKRALDNQESLELFPHIEKGMKVIVRSGPMKGVEGFVQQVKNKTKIILNIDFLQKAVAVEVDAEWLMPV